MTESRYVIDDPKAIVWHKKDEEKKKESARDEK